jgi:tripartite-type tricarboxylate transporter receptor subunit TctC
MRSSGRDMNAFWALVAVIGLGLGGPALDSAWAQSYPSHPVRIVVPTVAGGTVDVVTRIVANGLAGALGANVVVDNRSGAGNTLGSREVAHAEADGYTLLMSSSSGEVISPLVYRNIGYDPVKSFVPLALIAEGATVLVVNPALPFMTAKDVVAYAKANPGKLNYGSAGIGTVPHLIGELWKSRAGIDLVHVPYRGGAPATTDLIGGNIDMLFDAVGPLLPHIRDGRLRALAVTSLERIAELAEVPAMAEIGYPDVVSTSWTGLFAPAGTATPIVAKLNAAANQALTSADVGAALERIGYRARGGAPDALAAMVAAENRKWAPIVRALDLKAE